jgi:hypothetical protein
MSAELDESRKHYATRIRLASAPFSMPVTLTKLIMAPPALPSQASPSAPKAAEGATKPETTEAETSDEDLPIIRWQTTRAVRAPDDKMRRYLVWGLFALAALLLVFGTDVLAAIMFACFAGWVWYQGRLEIPATSYAISPIEIHVGPTVYHIREIQSFWIQYEPHLGIMELSLHLKRTFAPYVKIHLGDQDPVQIRSLLIEFIPEEVHEETIIDLLGRWIGL